MMVQIIHATYSFSTYNGKYGGAIAVHVDKSDSRLIVQDSLFHNNTAGRHGGAIDADGETVMVNISSCEFSENKAHENGGVLFYAQGAITISKCKFINNEASKIGGAMYVSSVVLKVTDCEFHNNVAGETWGGAISMDDVTGNITLSEFTNNSAQNMGVAGALRIGSYRIVIIKKCTFTNNRAHSGGVIHSSNNLDHQGHLYIVQSAFTSNVANSGSALFALGERISITMCSFTKSRAYGSIDEVGSIITYQSEDHGTISLTNTTLCNNNVDSGSIIYVTKSTINLINFTGSDNTASIGLLYLLQSEGSLMDSNAIVNNSGALYLFKSNATIADYTILQDNACLIERNQTENTREGCTITAFQSEVFFTGLCTITGNKAANGAGIHATQSKLYFHGDLTVSNNIASDRGGGMFIFQSEVVLHEESSLVLSGNNAKGSGGGLHATSSILYLAAFVDHVPVYIALNSARLGGGMYLEANSKVYILKSVVTYIYYGDFCEGEKSFYGNCSSMYTIGFYGNSADYGGAVFVADATNSGSTCTSFSFRVHTTLSECFLQSLALYTTYFNLPSIHTGDVTFELNQAYFSGSNIYGGLLDRCSVSPYAEVYRLYYPKDPTQHRPDVMNGVTYISKVTNVIDDGSISSGPIGICFCTNDELDCDLSTTSVVVKKGETFHVQLVAVDQLSHPKAATIHSTLNFSESGLGEGQLTQSLGENCTELAYNVISPNKTERLSLSALGPCRDAKLSQVHVHVTFKPCTCPIGFMPSATESYQRCDCECDSTLYPFITKCYKQNESLLRQGTFWVSVISNLSQNHEYTYLIYPVCPLDYCYSSSTKVYIDLNEKNGSDAQCNYERSEILCGVCKKGLSLSLGSSKCIECPSYWPLLLIGIVISAFLAGIVLVIVLLCLNLTVAKGTLNGIILYANIIHANRNTFLTFSKPNFATVFISWINMELGIDACFFKGMNTFWKTLLQLVFPTYVILLVITIIYISERSVRFARLIGRKNPVATLATLVLLSYTKLIQTVISSLSFIILEYPNGSKHVLWLPDASVQYIAGKHIVLFAVAILIILLGTAYTTVLFSWQWLLRYQHRRVLCWVRYQRLCLFLEPYHAPYVFKNRYWTGVLLIVRVVLYLISAVNVSSEPAVNLTAIGVTMLVILLFKGFLQQQKVYRKWLVEVLELVSYMNITLFTLFTLYTVKTQNENSKMQEVLAHISVSVTFLLFLVVVAYHMITECCISKESRRVGFLRRRVTQNDNSVFSNEQLPNAQNIQPQPMVSWVDAPSKTEQPLSDLVENRSIFDEQDEQEEKKLLKCHSPLKSSDAMTPLLTDVQQQLF